MANCMLLLIIDNYILLTLSLSHVQCPLGRINYLFSLIFSLWLQDKAQCLVPPLNTQYLGNWVENGNNSVLTIRFPTHSPIHGIQRKVKDNIKYINWRGCY